MPVFRPLAGIGMVRWVRCEFGRSGAFDRKIPLNGVRAAGSRCKGQRDLAVRIGAMVPTVPMEKRVGGLKSNEQRGIKNAPHGDAAREVGQMLREAGVKDQLALAALRIRSATALGWETMTTWEAPSITTVSCELARFAMNSIAAGGMFLSAVP